MQVENSLKLDVASILGPLFYVWIVQLLFPLFLTNIVYDKENRLRIIMNARDGTQKHQNPGTRPLLCIMESA